MSDLPLKDRTVLITGAAVRIGRGLARACANAGADVVIHFHHSQRQAQETLDEVRNLGRRAWLVEADLAREDEIQRMVGQAARAGPIYGLVNSAAIFEPLSMSETTGVEWNRHMAINLTAPFLLSKAFAAQVPPDGEGRIVNMTDWRAERPGRDHFPYSISKAALNSLTAAMAVALAPNITVNALALGAILPPADKTRREDGELLRPVPAGRWGELPEVEAALLFLIAGPAYVTGQVLYVDGGRHLT
jgi:NAD(P)-dependent dehydrogenase (short-subunit alcohol dehydrogenase family)